VTDLITKTAPYHSQTNQLDKLIKQNSIENISLCVLYS